MKLRNGYVSNSSSASFVLTKYKELTQEQIDQIKDHINVAKRLTEENPDKYIIKYHEPNEWSENIFGYFDIGYDEWELTETDKEIKGSTNMTNFDMEAFLKEIGIDFNFVKFGY